jgi:hypothetical protein
MPQLLYLQGKSLWYPLDWGLGRPQSQSGSSGEEKNSQTLQGLELPTIQPVAQCYTTELYQLLQLYMPLVNKNIASSYVLQFFKHESWDGQPDNCRNYTYICTSDLYYMEFGERNYANSS